MVGREGGKGPRVRVGVEAGRLAEPPRSCMKILNAQEFYYYYAELLTQVLTIQHQGRLYRNQVVFLPQDMDLAVTSGDVTHESAHTEVALIKNWVLVHGRHNLR